MTTGESVIRGKTFFTYIPRHKIQDLGHVLARLQVHVVRGFRRHPSAAGRVGGAARGSGRQAQLARRRRPRQVHAGAQGREEVGKLSLTHAHAHTCTSTRLTNVYFFFFFFSPKHFQDGRRAQQHIENSWKQLESVSRNPVSNDVSAEHFYHGGRWHSSVTFRISNNVCGVADQTAF